MNLSDSLTKLLKGGINDIVIGMNPQGLPYVQVKQVIKTGPEGNYTTVMHQKVDSSIVNCIERLGRDIEHCAELQTKIVQMNPN